MSVVFVSALLFDKNVLKIFKEDMLDLFTDNITMFGSFLLQQFSFLSERNIFGQVPLVRIQRPAICLAPRQNQLMVRLNNFDHNRTLCVSHNICYIHFVEHTHGVVLQDFYVNQFVVHVCVCVSAINLKRWPCFNNVTQV